MTVKEIVKNEPDSLIARAYSLAEGAHKGQKRASGEPYLIHPIKTADMLLEWHMDEETVIAGLLHDVVEDTDIPLSTIEKDFGKKVAFLVDGVTKLGRLKYRGEQAQKENVKKLIIASSEDIRVLLIKLADRYHNMGTLKALPMEKQKRVALETYEIYAPLAYRLGMQKLSGELEDLAFPYINPDAYEWLMSNAKQRFSVREKYLMRIKPIVIEALKKAKIDQIAIDLRAKRYSSLYKKLLRYDMDIDRIHDLVAFRIIVLDVSKCYEALGVIHSLWPPMPGRFKDYIAMPKPNGYRSLHTVVFAVGGKAVEFQIRTQEMHDEAENGIAAHWLYEEKKGGKGYNKRKSIFAREEELTWVKRLRQWQDTENEKDRTIDNMKIDFFKDRIFVITPKGRVIDLPVGATPVDFAYHIHSAVGDQCVSAKVNGKMVPLDFKLRSADIVQIITQKKKKPSAGWLEFVKTSHARHHIKKHTSAKDTSLVQKVRNVEFRIFALDRIGLIKDLSEAVSKTNTNILSVTSSTEHRKDELHLVKIKCNTEDPERIQKIIIKIKKVKGVNEVDYRFS